jgi:hypothetical protein
MKKIDLKYGLPSLMSSLAAIVLIIVFDAIHAPKIFNLLALALLIAGLVYDVIYIWKKVKKIFGV